MLGTYLSRCQAARFAAGCFYFTVTQGPILLLYEGAFQARPMRWCGLRAGGTESLWDTGGTLAAKKCQLSTTTGNNATTRKAAPGLRLRVAECCRLLMEARLKIPRG